MDMNKWVKPNGTELMLNDNAATEEVALRLGWKPAKTHTSEAQTSGKSQIKEVEAKGGLTSKGK